MAKEKEKEKEKDGGLGMPHYTHSVVFMWESRISTLPRLLGIVGVFVRGLSSLAGPSVGDDVHRVTAALGDHLIRRSHPACTGLLVDGAQG